jgi:hypothetical protein
VIVYFRGRGGRKSITLLEGSQAAPTRRDRNNVEEKTLGL